MAEVVIRKLQADVDDKRKDKGSEVEEEMASSLTDDDKEPK